MSSVGHVAYVVSYRRGSNSQNERYVLLEIEGVRSDSEAARFVGRKVLWRSPNGKLSVKGVIVRVHGCRGRVVARFRKPLPGQAVGTQVTIL
jgi:large subunit ribosomal protein L35Ae